MSLNAVPETPEAPAFFGFARLAQQVFDGVDLKPLTAQLIERANSSLDETSALMDLSVIFQFGGGQDELALALQAQALEVQPTYTLPAAAQPTRLTVLALMTPGLLVDNLPLDPLLNGSDITLIQHYLTGTQLPDPARLPEHDLLFVAIGESDKTQPLLAALVPHLADWPKPVLNRPEHIADMARDKSARKLADLPGALVPPSTRVSRLQLQRLVHGLSTPSSLFGRGSGVQYPLIVRPVGTHAGKGLERIDSGDALAAYLQMQPGDTFTLSPFVDYAGPDGLYRKYRVAMINGQPFASHMAVSSRWMVHYLNADMTESAAKRGEEAAFMQGFDSGFATRHAAALAEIQQRLQLDYYAIDCAETPVGELLIFEADTAMIVHAFDPESVFPYKKPQMEKVFKAFREFLYSRG